MGYKVGVLDKVRPLSDIVSLHFLELLRLMIIIKLFWRSSGSPRFWRLGWKPQMRKDFLYNLWIFNGSNNLYLATALVTLADVDVKDSF
jgi:hypothetical protein